MRGQTESTPAADHVAIPCIGSAAKWPLIRLLARHCNPHTTSRPISWQTAPSRMRFCNLCEIQQTARIRPAEVPTARTPEVGNNADLMAQPPKQTVVGVDRNRRRKTRPRGSDTRVSWKARNARPRDDCPTREKASRVQASSPILPDNS